MWPLSGLGLRRARLGCDESGESAVRSNGRAAKVWLDSAGAGGCRAFPVLTF